MGSAKIRRSGKDVTLVTWGNCVEIAEAAADLLRDEISVEIIDLRCIQPWDRQMIARSLQDSGRLVVVQEDGRSCSVGQMIISEILSDPGSFYQLLSPPQLVSKCDVPIGYNPIYEFTALPDQQRVVAALHAVMEY
jgi:2-oxoisovalerate dehydrogenase E1 component